MKLGNLRYVRTIARKQNDIILEQAELRKMIEGRMPKGRGSSNEVGPYAEPYRHPVFEKPLEEPMDTIDKFREFEAQLEKPVMRKQCVCTLFTTFIIPYIWHYNYDSFHIFTMQIEALRALGGNNVGQVIRKCWREAMTDSLMSQFTWTGQLKPSSVKEPGLSLDKSKIALAIYGELQFSSV